MPHDTGERGGMSAAELRHHLSNLAAGLIRIEHQLLRLELESERTLPTGPLNGSAMLTSVQWLKVLAGLSLPLLVLLATGNVELARKLIAP